MVNTVTVVYVINGSTQIDVLYGSTPTVQRLIEGFRVSFPSHDGYMSSSTQRHAEGAKNIRAMSYSDAPWVMVQ